MGRRSKIDVLRERHESAKLAYETRVFERAGKLLDVRQEYDGAENDRKRRPVYVERQNEEGILNASRRLTGVARTRDLERNYSNAKALVNTFRVNVVGHLAKLTVNVENGADATRWFNGVWAKQCDARDDNHFCDLLGVAVGAVIREGDIGVVVDDGVFSTGGDGKLWLYESDQFVKIDGADFDKAYPGHTQEQGVIRNPQGVVVGYAVGKTRGAFSAKLADCVVFPRETMRLLKRPWRANQGRGVADLLTSVNDLFDLYDMRSRELQTAKVAASLAGSVKRTEAVSNFDDPTGGLSLLPESTGRTAEEMRGDQAQGGTGPNYERFEALTGGNIEYLDPRDAMELFKIDRPNVNAAEFHDFVLSSAGASVGLARAMARMRADSSYTAFRGDMIMSWPTIYGWQKWLERRLCDWVAVKVLRWAMRAGVIDPLPDGWESALSWQWPAMPEVDEGQAEKARAQRFHNGGTTFDREFGPDWETGIRKYAEQLNLCRELGVPVAGLETSTGNERQADAPGGATGEPQK